MELFDTDTKVAVLQSELKNLIISVQEFRKDSKEQHMEMLKEIGNLDHRIKTIEKWKWMVIGGAVVIGYLISHLKVIPLSFG